MGRSASTEEDQEEFEFPDTNWNVGFTRRPTADGWRQGESDGEAKKDGAGAPEEGEVPEVSAKSAAKMLGKSALIASSLGFSTKSKKGRKQPPPALGERCRDPKNTKIPRITL